MDYNREQLTNLLAQAKLTSSDFARIMGVSRVTIYNWLNVGEPHKILRPKYEKITAAIKRAADAGDLPVTERRAEQRRLKILSAIRLHIGR